MNKLTIYASGNMTPEPEVYYDWVGPFAYEVDLLYHVSISQLKDAAEQKFIVQHDLARLKKSDIVVVNLGVKEKWHHLTGLVVEVYEAYKQNKPVYAFVGEGLRRSAQADSAWIQQFVTHEFATYEDLVDYLMVDENLPR